MATTETKNETKDGTTAAASFDDSWTSSDLAKAVCDNLVAAGKIRAKPAFIRTDREAKIVKVFESAKLDGAKMGTCNARGVEVAVRNVTQGEAWVDDVQNALREMLSADKQKDQTGPAESEELKAIKAAQLERARADFEADPTGDGVGGSGRMKGDDRTCFTCGRLGHISRDCPEVSGGGRKRGGSGGDYGNFISEGGGRDIECYNCHKLGHISRDCPSSRMDTDDNRLCYNCGRGGHISRECPEPSSGGY